MPDTPLGITYPDSAADTQLWLHYQAIAEDVDTLVTADRTRLTAIERAPIAKLVATAGQSIPNNAATKVDFGATAFAQGCTADLSSDRITATKAGFYIVSGLVFHGANATGSRNVYVYVNGSAVDAVGVPAPSATSMSVPIRSLVQLAVGDYVELFTLQNSGGALGLQLSGAFRSRLELSYVGAVAP